MGAVARAGSPPPPDSNKNLTLRRVIPAGIPVPSLTFLSDEETAGKVKAYAPYAFVLLGSFFALTNGHKLAFLIGGILHVFGRSNVEQIAQGFELASKCFPLGKEPQGLLSLFIQMEEATEEAKTKSSRNAFLMLMIINLITPWLMQKSAAAYFGFQATRLFYTLRQAPIAM